MRYSHRWLCEFFQIVERNLTIILQLPPKHTVDSAYGTKNPVHYFLDWIAEQPISMLYDDQFTTRRPKLVKAFNEWMDNKRFSITMVKYGDEKTVYFNYNKHQILRVKFK